MNRETRTQTKIRPFTGSLRDGVSVSPGKDGEIKPRPAVDVLPGSRRRVGDDLQGSVETGSEGKEDSCTDARSSVGVWTGTRGTVLLGSSPHGLGPMGS